MRGDQSIAGTLDVGEQEPKEHPCQPLALTVEQAAAFLQLDPRTVRDMYRRGELAGNQAGRAIRLSRSSVVDWLSGKRPSRSRR